MPEGERSNSDDPAQPPQKRPREPLYLRMYFQSHLTDLVRLFGYREISLDQARKELTPLIEKYGKQVMVDAAEEIVFIDNSKTPEVARLSDQARKLARQLLGRPPELANGSSPLSGPGLTAANSVKPSAPNATYPVSADSSPPVTPGPEAKAKAGRATRRTKKKPMPENQANTAE